jgi:hypothetical protein
MPNEHLRLRPLRSHVFGVDLVERSRRRTVRIEERPLLVLIGDQVADDALELVPHWRAIAGGGVRSDGRG